MIFLIFSSLFLTVLCDSPVAVWPGSLPLGQSAYSIIQAEFYDASSVGVGVDFHCNNVMTASYINVGDNLKYMGLDFGDDGANMLTLQFYSTVTQPATVTISVLGSPIATFTVGNTGGDCDWFTLTVFLSKVVTGINNIEFQFDSPISEDIFNLDWFQFGVAGSYIGSTTASVTTVSPG